MFMCPLRTLRNQCGFTARSLRLNPTVIKPDYAKWMLDYLRVNFAISARSGATGLDHLGIQVETPDELHEVYGRLRPGLQARRRWVAGTAIATYCACSPHSSGAAVRRRGGAQQPLPVGFRAGAQAPQMRCSVGREPDRGRGIPLQRLVERRHRSPDALPDHIGAGPAPCRRADVMALELPGSKLMGLPQERFDRLVTRRRGRLGQIHAERLIGLLGHVLADPCPEILMRHRPGVAERPAHLFGVVDRPFATSVQLVKRARLSAT